MKATSIAAVVVAVCLVTVGAVAATASTAPDGAPVGETPADDDPGQSSERGEGDDARQSGDTNATESDAPAAPGANAGPPTDMPAQVPDFVTTLHETIQDYLSGALDTPLGEAIQDIVPGDASEDSSTGDDQSAGDTAGNASSNGSAA